MAKHELKKVNINVEFEETANRQQLSSGDNIKTLFGKIKKWLSDLKKVAFTGSYDDLINVPHIPAYEVVSKTTNGLVPKLPNETATTKYLRQDGTWTAPLPSDIGALPLTGGTVNGNLTVSGLLSAGNNVSIYSDNEGGNIRIVSPDGTMWEVDAVDGNLRIFTYANGTKAGIIINTLGQVIFPEGAWSDIFHGVLYGSVIAAGGVGGRGTQMSANGFHVDLPPEEGYAGGLAWYQGNTGVGCFGYYKQGGYHYVGTDYANPAGELRAGNIYANNNVFVKFPYALYVRHIEGADGGNLFLNYNNPNVAVVIGDTSSTGTGYGTLNVGSRAQLRTDNEGGNFRLQSPNGMIYEMDAHDDLFRLYGYPNGSTYYTLLKAMIDGGVDFPQGIVLDHINGRRSASPYIRFDPAFNDASHPIQMGYFSYPEGWKLIPIDSTYSLGDSYNRWTQVYAINSAISTSDERLKTDIKPLDENLTQAFIMGLNPISYIRTDAESGRTHYGMGAQTVERLMEELGMTSMDFAGLIKSPMYEDYEVEEEVEVEKLIPNENGKPIPQKVKEMQKVTKQREIPGEYRYGLRYEEFIAPLIKMVQIQQLQIEEQENRIADLEKKMVQLISAHEL